MTEEERLGLNFTKAIIALAQEFNLTPKAFATACVAAMVMGLQPEAEEDIINALRGGFAAQRRLQDAPK